VIAIKKVHRRGFLKTGIGAAAGLTLGFTLPEKSRLVAQSAAQGVAQAARQQFALSGYIHIGADDSVTMVLPKSEMGQGPMTGLTSWIASGGRCGRCSRL
jgi:isoquinoline 1-oxidoreductase subunit beta